MTNDNRVPAGVPTGGQFATGERAESADLPNPRASVDLTAGHPFDPELCDRLIAAGEDEPGWFGGQDEGFATWMAKRHLDPERPGRFVGETGQRPADRALLEKLNGEYREEQLNRYQEHALSVYDRLGNGRPGGEAFAAWVLDSAKEERLPSDPERADIENEFYTYRDDAEAYEEQW